jgi:hypothetical protein
LSAVGSLYDPFGMVSPVTLPGKRILQRACKLKLKWDDLLPQELCEVWLKWKESLVHLEGVRIPRCYFREDNYEQVELHHFADASEVGYGTVSYLRRNLPDGSGECSFVWAKSRTAPSSFVSVPRLELQAAVTAVRVDRFIREELLQVQLIQVYFWSDSRVVLGYVKNETKRFKTYVANRVTEIRNSSTPSQWYHVSGRDNPADEASRGQTVSMFQKNDRWFKGPTFLSRPKSEWPMTTLIEEIDESDPEVKTEKIIAASTDPATDGLLQLILRSSSWIALQRHVALLMKFIEYLQWKRKAKVEKVEFQKKLTPADLEGASRAVVKLVQNEVYAKEIAEIKKNGRVNAANKLVSLNPVLIAGLLRVGGRISRAPISFDSKHPMVIPKDHHLGRLLIHHYHEGTAHGGQDHVLAKIREKYWILNGKTAIRQALKYCIGCRRRNALRMNQLMAELPAVRLVGYQPPFTYTGVDYFGPMLIKQGRNSSVKRWGVLFTCLNVKSHTPRSCQLPGSQFLLECIPKILWSTWRANTSLVGQWNEFCGR